MEGRNVSDTESPQRHLIVPCSLRCCVMSKAKRVFLILLVILVGTLFSACDQGKSDPQETEETVTKVVFSEKILGIAQMSPEDWMSDLMSTSEGNYENVYVNDAGTAVTLEITDTQKEYWMTSREKLLTDLKSQFAQLGTGYKIEYSDDYSHIDLYYNLELDAYEAIRYVMSTEVFCANLQLLSGVEHDQWKVSFNIYNSETGKLVTSGNSDTGLSYDASDWEASM